METIPSRTIPSKVALLTKISAILLLVLALYYQDLVLVANEALRSEIMSYLLAIPILFAYLLYRKRRMIRAAISFETLEGNKKPEAQPPRPTGAVLHKKPTINFNQIIGALACLTAFLLYWHGSYTFHPLEYHMLSLPIFLSGAILVVFNAKTLIALAFPIALLVFLTPPPIEILSALGSALSIASSESAYRVLKVAGLPVALSAQYGTPAITLVKPSAAPITFTIDMACAGFYSLIGFIVFATFIAYLTQTHLIKKAAVFLVGIPLMFTLNIARIIIIVLVGNQYGEETALQAFHLMGGWVLILAGSVLLSTASEKIFKIPLFTKKPNKGPCGYCSPNPKPKQHFCTSCGRLINLTNVKLTKRDLGRILVIIASTIIILNMQVPVFALTEGPVQLNIRTLSGEEVMVRMLPTVPEYTSIFIGREKLFEEQAQQDASLIYAYSPNDPTKNAIWVVLEIAKTRASMHPWEVCLITWQIAHGYQPQITQLSQRDVRLLENPPIIARFFSFRDLRTGLIQVILYWYESAFFNVGSGMEREYAKISFVAYAESPEDVPSVEDSLLPFGIAMVDYWLPIKSWSLASLLVSQNGLVLVTISATILALALVVKSTRSQRQNPNVKAYNKLASEQEKLILQAVHKAEKQGKSTGEAIVSILEKLTGKNVETHAMLEELGNAEEAGFIRSELDNRDDEPILIWKTRIPFFEQSRLQNVIGRIQRAFERARKPASS